MRHRSTVLTLLPHSSCLLHLTSVLLLLTSPSPFGSLQAQVTLQPWVQVFGTVGGSKLGFETLGITPTGNFEYKASIYQSGNSGMYTLESQQDTIPQRVFLGQNLHTGDLNGDGWEDVVLRKLDDVTHIDTVTILWGTSSGIDTSNVAKVIGSGTREGFGTSICVGNLIGDNVDDLIVGANEYPFGLFQGRVYIYEGGLPFGTVPAVILKGDSSYYNLGRACAIGDVNDDGQNDLFVRGLHSDTPRFEFVDIWFGAVPWDSVSDLRLSGPESGSRGLVCLDANDDGIDDLLWTNRDPSLADQVWIHFGAAAFDTIPSLVFDDPGVANFGDVIMNAGDMNGDGYDDIAVSAPSATITSGFVFVFGAGPQIDGDYDAAVGMSSDSDFGRSVSSVGDVSGDGLSDIIVGAPNYEFGTDKGYWGIFMGDSSIIVSDVRDEQPLSPSVARLYQSYPNPFNPTTIIQYDLNQSSDVTLEVFDVTGRKIHTLVAMKQVSGRYEVLFDGEDLASGVYLYRLTVQTETGGVYEETKRLTLLK